jgi:DNA-binding MurR/RpiR family transcriptional regulator
MKKDQETIHLSELEQEVDQYVSENVEKVQMMSIRELAANTFSNTTTILRYTRKLGYSGFEEFKVKIKSDLQSRNSDDYIINARESAIEVINKMKTLNRQVIDQTVDRLSLEQINRILHKIEDMEFVDFIAYDANAALADYASHYFFQVSKICNVYEDIDQQIGFAQNADPSHHIVFVLTRSGRSSRILQVLKELKKHGMYTVLISSASGSSVAPMCNEFLETIFVDSFKDMGDCTYYASAKFLLDLIINLYFSKHYEDVLKKDTAYDKAYFSI